MHWILLRVVLGNSQRLEFLRRSRLRSRAEKAGKPSLSPAVEAFLRRRSSIF
jgi:hypothetical protein